MIKFEITKQSTLENSPDSFTSCLFHNVICGDVIIKEWDFLSSHVIYSKNKKINSWNLKTNQYYRKSWDDVLKNNARKWDCSYGKPQMKSGDLTLFNSELFYK
jgi:hypothetical protein